MTAAHIFPYGAGQAMMDNFFGRERENKPEMFEIENGMIISTDAEDKISSGQMALVPGVREDASNDEIDDWRESHPRPYKIHIFNPDSKEMNKIVPPFFGVDMTTRRQGQTWADLHGQNVEFRSDHRPRARYLYWQWMINMLKAVMQVNHRVDNPMPKEFGKRFWGTGGKWIKKKYLLGLAEYAGHAFEWDNLLEAAQEPEKKEDNEPDSAAAIVGAVQMRGGFLEELRDEDEDEDEDDDDDEDEDEDEGDDDDED